MLALLRRAARHRRDQQHLLPDAQGRAARALGGTGAERFRLRPQGLAAHHPHEAAQGRGGKRRLPVRDRGGPGREARARVLPAPALLQEGRAPAASSFLELLPPGRPVAFEFRHESWFDDEVYDALARPRRRAVRGGHRRVGGRRRPHRPHRKLGVPAPPPGRVLRPGPPAAGPTRSAPRRGSGPSSSSSTKTPGKAPPSPPASAPSWADSLTVPGRRRASSGAPGARAGRSPPPRTPPPRWSPDAAAAW